jgi:hypothetical protein
MHTREEILQLYYAGSENVITLIKDLEIKLQNQEEIIKQQIVIITTLKGQAKVSQDTEFLYIKLKEQMERIETQLKLLNQK